MFTSYTLPTFSITVFSKTRSQLQYIFLQPGFIFYSFTHLRHQFLLHPNQVMILKKHLINNFIENYDDRFNFCKEQQTWYLYCILNCCFVLGWKTIPPAYDTTTWQYLLYTYILPSWLIMYIPMSYSHKVNKHQLGNIKLCMNWLTTSWEIATLCTFWTEKIYHELNKVMLLNWRYYSFNLRKHKHYKLVQYGIVFHVYQTDNYSKHTTNTTQLQEGGVCVCVCV